MRKLAMLFSFLILAVPCGADTFTHRETGAVFHGYATQSNRGDKTLVRIGDKHEPKYINPTDYHIEWNCLGRRNQIILLSIKNEINLICETETFERAIEAVSNQGPLIILIEIDTPGGSMDLTRRISAAITKTSNCRTVAFVCGGKYGGAYSAGAIIALACDYIYMKDATAIGAATGILVSSSDVKDIKSVYGETVGEKFLSAERAYIATLAEQNGRPGLLAKAMVDKDIEVLQVIENGNSIFIEPENKKAGQSPVRIWSQKGSLLTLTANEAVECGIADRLADTHKEIISDLRFENPQIIHDTEIVKARSRFEITERKFKRICDDIDYLQKEADTLQTQFNSVTEYYNREVDKLNNMVTSSSDAYHYAIESQEKLVKKIERKRNNLRSALFDALQKLTSKCKAAIALGKFYPDLHIDVEALKKEINSIRVLGRNIK